MGPRRRSEERGSAGERPRGLSESRHMMGSEEGENPDKAGALTVAWRVGGAGRGQPRERGPLIREPEGRDHQERAAARPCHCHLSASTEFSPGTQVSDFPSAPETSARPGASLRRWQERLCLTLGCQSPILKLLGAPVIFLLACRSIEILPSKLIRN